MKNLIELLSEIIKLIRSSPTKIPGKILLVIRYLSFLLDILKQWFDKDNKNGSQRRRLKFS
ncbi:Uncharacterised protein [Sphingobacterium daejeonense]|nr:Uncharacterised protein [Sphingobacterium daejeonense]